MPHTPVDPVALTADLVRCASVTPEEGGALVLLERLLGAAGFECARADRQGIANLYARWGARGLRAVSALTGTRMWCHWAMPPRGAFRPSGPKSGTGFSGVAEPRT